MSDFIYKKECYKIIGACMTVHNELGSGFLEAVYQEALAIEFKENNIRFFQEHPIDVYYKDKLLSKKYYVDFICYEEIIIELKAVKELSKEHYAQLLNYLKATKNQIGLLINFGKERLEYKRFIL